ncbi:MAG TPA: bifunctional (p)ppGpp synthetase/guanosine-3',5'-bis(diphosphate) 3'-pyrophosphohydrolase [Ktedonobacteraceae bacterium]|nr:bifunctional (p)ppGpp synthetase/guanosine-3',5'-bis(diphosphate) 3'-pyrophosphohydrolase [Ktedonobacteraceae bacterium]
MMTANPDESVAISHLTLEDLLAETRQYLSPLDLETIRRAYEVADEAHQGIMRRSGEPYISHPLEVALLLADMRIDADGIVAGLLHDVVEDTAFTLDDLRALFGAAIADIVDGVTKFDTLAGKNGASPFMASTQSDQDVGTRFIASSVAPETPEQIEQRQSLAREQKRRDRSETVRKMLLAMAEDPRVVVLKLADRLHNMRTLSVMNRAQQQNKARETREIYAPLARRLGMSLVQAELEDLAFSYLEPEKFTRLASAVEAERRKRQPIIDQICRSLEEEMDKAGIHAEVRAWPKHLSSINRKLEQGGTELSQIHDLVAYRILVDTVHDCYLALGHIHALWRPKDGRIKDFIATPKVNGYQSLHTTVFCLDNQLAEVQIRTHEMERIADYGIASYWYLKERGGARLSMGEMITWIEQLREWQRELPQNADEFVEAVKGDIFQEQIFVFTPKGEVKDLPRGSTPLDLAYRIHSDIGDHCAGARIITNLEDSGRLITRIVPLDYELKGGEIVDIMVSPDAHPTREWLSFARTTSARTKIRRYLKTYERDVNLHLGRERLDLALKAAGASGLHAVTYDDLLVANPSKKYSVPDDLFIALGRDDLAVGKVMEYLTPLLQQRGEIKAEAELPKNGHHHNGSAADSELSQVVIKLAHCCCPLPGDAIVGLLNPNKGIIVHRADCRTLRRYRGHDSERLLDINWLVIEAQSYRAPIIIVAHDRAGLLRDVAAVVADAGINMTSVASTTNASLQKAVITATLEIEAVDQIEPIFERLQQIKNVVSVGRDLGRGVHS